MVLWGQRKRTTSKMATRSKKSGTTLEKFKLQFEELPHRVYNLNKRTRRERDESSISR
jgi:hypothetical protein